MPTLSRSIRAALAAALVLPAFAAAQTAADSGRFVVRHGADTVAIETFKRVGVQLTGTVAIPKLKSSESWTATIAPDESVPLFEVRVTEPPRVEAPAGADSKRYPDPKPRISQRARFIFKGDSVAVDAMRTNGLETRILGTQVGAVPYVNLSFALLDQVLRRAGKSGGQVPIFNVAGGQTAVATVTRGADSAAVTIGSVTFALKLNGAGRVVEGRIPAQDVVAVRE
jgi:hypothetical protein